jgi:hypothetical protein
VLFAQTRELILGAPRLMLDAGAAALTRAGHTPRSSNTCRAMVTAELAGSQPA